MAPEEKQTGYVFSLAVPYSQKQFLLLATATTACTPVNKAKKAMTAKWLTPEQAIGNRTYPSNAISEQRTRSSQLLSSIKIDFVCLKIN
ncbi:MAG: hypothetical protein ACR9NN_20860 [Nostochopsis sp.]